MTIQGEEIFFEYTEFFWFWPKTPNLKNSPIRQSHSELNPKHKLRPVLGSHRSLLGTLSVSKQAHTSPIPDAGWRETHCSLKWNGSFILPAKSETNPNK